MARAPKSNDAQSAAPAVLDVRIRGDDTASRIDPRSLGLVKVAYGVRETLKLLSIGRTSLYAAVKRGDLKRAKLGRKTLFYAADLAAFLARLRRPG
jgi:excisionase family DNA binding protein